MYGNVLPKTGWVLSGAGLATTAYHLTWLAIAFFVLAGTLITMAKLFPRIAIEPLPEARPASRVRYRWKVTVNGVTPGRHRG